jgi:Na+/proline symporter
MGEHFLHPMIFGLVMAALLAAIMSTIDSQVLVVASAITRDLRKARRKPPLPDRQAAWIGRVTSAALIVVAGGLAQYSLATAGGKHPGVISGLVNQLVLFAWGGLGAAFGPALLLSLYSRRMTGGAALAAMLTGGITACVWRGLVKAHLPAGAAWISYELTVAFPLALLAGWLALKIRPNR